MFLIVGLGNYGVEYKNTRHNVGFLFIDYLKEKYNLNDFKKKYDFLYSLNNYFNSTFVLIKPLTYMNLSGKAIVQALNFFKIDITNLIIIYDDIALPFSKIRIREKGTHGGHKGLKNIQLNLGTTEYKRIRIGIYSDTTEKLHLKDYVLSNFTQDEIIVLKERIFPAVEDAMKIIISGNIKEAMNKYNGRNLAESKDSS